MAFYYAPEWYGSDEYVEWIRGIRSKEDLLKNYERQSPYRERFVRWFQGEPVRGRILELGFNDGKSLRWLFEMFGRLEFYTFDWSPRLDAIVPFLREVIEELVEVRYYDCKAGIRAESDFFDAVLSLDFFEHLTPEIYHTVIREIQRVLAPGGICYVYVGKGASPEHINLRSEQEVYRDMLTAGFELARVKHFAPYRGEDLLVFRKPSTAKDG